MNDLSPINSSGALAVPQQNFFEQYAEAANTAKITGELLKHNKGDWLFGKDSHELARGTRLIANILDLKVGWQRWEGGKPTDSRLGRVMDGFAPPVRASLGDNDPSYWEVDEKTGKPRDPWQLTNVLVLKDEKGDRLFTFSPSSKGAIGAIAKLSGEFGKQMRMKVNQLPIVALEVDSYMHPDKSIGRVKVPVLKLVGWADKAAFDEALAAEEAATEDRDQVPFEVPSTRSIGEAQF